MKTENCALGTEWGPYKDLATSLAKMLTVKISARSSKDNCHSFLRACRKLEFQVAVRHATLKFSLSRQLCAYIISNLFGLKIDWKYSRWMAYSGPCPLGKCLLEKLLARQAYLIVVNDFHSTKWALWLVDSWSHVLNQIQMYPNRDTIAQLLPARHLCLFVLLYERLHM